MKISPCIIAIALASSCSHVSCFSGTTTTTTTSSSSANEIAKKRLLDLIGKQSTTDPVLADPVTKEPIEIAAPGILWGGERRRNIRYSIQSPSNQFQGSSDTFLNLLEPIRRSGSSGSGGSDEKTSSRIPTTLLKQALPYVPAPLRGPIATLTGSDEFVPMRDLFTSPAVSYAYERGWRQGFQRAGFPGPDKEAQMAMDYFAPVVENSDSSVLVDMSCATGLFTRRFAAADVYHRVMGCDYSESMLTEARRRITAEPKLDPSNNNWQTTTQLDLIRLDVGQIPMQTGSVDCLHAGAAMHCWPDLDAAAQEIYRVLKPGGRYFATTFLNQYFATLSNLDGNAGVPPSQQAFQYFESVDTLRNLLERGGFESDKIVIEVLGSACVVIRAEK